MHGKRPTVAQRKLIEKFNLNSDNWLIQKDTNEFMQMVHRVSGTVKKLPKGAPKV